MNKIKSLSPDEFRKMQLLELEMLVELDKVCKNNRINYSIFGGTLLGAVRHKGFIPWDDDIDIVMLREDYEKFIQVVNQLDPEICFFQDYKTDKYYRWGYSKLRRVNTEYIRIGQEHLKNKTGFFIDIFPLDDIPHSIIGQIINDFYCCCLRKILYSEVGKLNYKFPFYIRKWYNLLSKIPTSFVYKKLEKMASKSNNKSNKKVRCLLFPATGKLYVKNSISTRFGMPKEWFTNLNYYEFEGLKFSGTKDYDSILKYIYGNYIKLPPEDKRDPHSPVSKYSFNVIGKKLKRITNNNNDIVCKIIKNDKLQNPYLYIDSIMYGLSNDNVKTFLLKNKIILYHYYNNLQIFQIEKLSKEELQIVVNHIKKYKFNMISGNCGIINQIKEELTNTYDIEIGYIMKYNRKTVQKSNLSRTASLNDYDDISKLICSDENIGGHYTISGLKMQLLERKNNRNCMNIIIKEDNQLVAHAATYADTDEFAIIGGIITNKKFRGKGYGQNILNDITSILIEENKIPILYCYSDELKKWYSKQGYQVISKCAKLEIRK